MKNNFKNYIDNGTKMKISSVIYRPLEVSAYWQQDWSIHITSCNKASTSSSTDLTTLTGSRDSDFNLEIFMKYLIRLILKCYVSAILWFYPHFASGFIQVEKSGEKWINWIISEIPHRNKKNVFFRVPMNPYKDWKAKLERPHSLKSTYVC